MLFFVTGAGVGVARRQVPAFSQFTGQFQFHTLGGGAGSWFVDVLTGVGVGGDVLGDVVLFDAEEGQAGVQLAFEVGGFQTGLVAVAFHRFQGLAAGVLVDLRLVDAGVAGIHRVRIVEVIDHTGVRRDHAMFLVAGVGIGQARAWIVGVVFVVLEGADTAAEDERQVVRRTQARGQVSAVLALGTLVLAVFRELLFRDVAFPVKDVARHQFEGAGVVGGTGLTRVRRHETCDQFMLTAAEGKRTGDVDVSGVLYAVAFPATPVEEHAFAGGAIRVTAAGRG
ncbi:hypothetical protein D3C87_1200560 [compost metagenome]